MLAVARGYKGKLKDKDGKVLMNEKNEPADLYDMLINNSKGMLVLDPRVANVSLFDIRSTIAGLQKKSNQIKGSVDRSMAERRAAGKLVTLFRRFLAPGFRRHWGHGGLANVSRLHVDTETGMLSEGAYWTTYKYIRDQVQTIASKQPANVWNLLTVDEKANVRRTAAQSLFLVSSTIIAGLLMGAAADEDDEEVAAKYIFWAYQARRLQTELGAFVSPKEAYKKKRGHPLFSFLIATTNRVRYPRRSMTESSVLSSTPTFLIRDSLSSILTAIESDAFSLENIRIGERAESP
jgi:hypothetical protein